MRRGCTMNSSGETNLNAALVTESVFGASVLLCHNEKVEMTVSERLQKRYPVFYRERSFQLVHCA